MEEGTNVTTSSPNVRLRTHTTGTEDRQVHLVEYQYQYEAKSWVRIQPQDSANANLTTTRSAETGVNWQLTPSVGVKYIQARAVDLRDIRHRRHNYTPETSVIANDQTQVYRYALNVGELVTFRLESLQGDADLYIFCSQSKLYTSNGN